MRIQRLEVENFRAITRIVLGDLHDVVVVAGPNGCGKSAIFDAIRLFKSAYGGYQPNEWQQWFGEFQINLSRRQEDLLNLFQVRSQPLRIFAEIALSEEERSFLRGNAPDLKRDAIWRTIAPEAQGSRYLSAAPLAAQLRTHAPQVDQRAQAELPALLSELDQLVFTGELVIDPNGEIRVRYSHVLDLVFTMYAPQSIGVIDYHGAQRNYAREQVGGINLNIESSEQQLKQHALYNYANKYSNIKTEMAASYVRDLLAREVGGSSQQTDSLVETLKELFATFFPGKQFLGPQPTSDGRIFFPVRTESGAVHDINDLSSGEKEVLYGYLRLRNTAPKNSVLLIDEPELHLNPRLIQGLPQFYHKHLGRALGNQLWLVTHSDALLRQAVGEPGFRVFHMHPPTSERRVTTQVSEILAKEDLERAIIDLVGDLAAYRPGGKLVVFEGGGDSELDLRIVSVLFPTFVAKVNAIASGNKQRVRDLHAILERARHSGHVPVQFYSIVDRDSGEPVDGTAARVFTWDVYHIENYLLEPRYILRVLQDLNVREPAVADEAAISSALLRCAELTLPTLTSHELQRLVNRSLVECIRTRVDPRASQITPALREVIESSVHRITEVAAGQLAQSELERKEAEVQSTLRRDLVSGAWRKTFRGRDVLRRFVGEYGGSVKYEVFRDLVLARMHDAGVQPPGMKLILDTILADPWGSRSPAVA